MSILRVATIEPEGATTTLTLGASGDTVTSSADSIKGNTFKDAGGNTLWTSDGAGTLSSVSSGISSKGPQLILSQTASNSSSVDFTTGIDSTYKIYMFLFTDIRPVYNGARLRIQFNASGQTGFNENITSTFFDAENSEPAGDATLGYKPNNDQAGGTSPQDVTREIGGDDQECAAGMLYLYEPSSTVQVKNFWARINSHYHADYKMDNFAAGFVNVTSAITEVQFTVETGNFAGKITLYGIT